MLDTRVILNGIQGYVIVDHQDGTYTVIMEDNTIYLAMTEELKPNGAKIEYKWNLLDFSNANYLMTSLWENKKHAYRDTLKFLKNTCGINAGKKNIYSVIDILREQIKKANGWV